MRGDNQVQADDVSGAADDPADATPAPASSADDLRASLHISERCYEDLDHGPKPADCQKYIVLHDTEGDSSPADTIDWWESNGNSDTSPEFAAYLANYQETRTHDGQSR